jgi:hypothetical protein
MDLTVPLPSVFKGPDVQSKRTVPLLKTAILKSALKSPSKSYTTSNTPSKKAALESDPSVATKSKSLLNSPLKVPSPIQKANYLLNSPLKHKSSQSPKQQQNIYKKGWEILKDPSLDENVAGEVSFIEDAKQPQNAHSILEDLSIPNFDVDTITFDFGKKEDDLNTQDLKNVPIAEL